jgi:AcrR family transcriptional regulator
VDAVAVEPIASELGATKGSFYWHFKNRDALIEAALDEWEKRLTEDLIQQLELEADPALRLRKLFMTAFELGPTDRAAEIALLSKPDHPAVVARVRRVAQRRITFVCSQLEELGWDSTQALDRAVLISYLYVGYLQARHVLPDAVSVNDRRRQVQLLFETLVAADLSAGWVDPVPMRS